jgi:hypothetical protein
MGRYTVHREYACGQSSESGFEDENEAEQDMYDATDDDRVLTALLIDNANPGSPTVLLDYDARK